MSVDEVVVAALRHHPAFATATMDEMRAIAADAELIVARPGHLFFRAAEPANWVYVLIQGILRVFHENGDEQITVKHLQAPATFGEMEVVTGESYLEHAAAMNRCVVVRMWGAAFVAYLESSPTATRSLLRDVCARFCVAARNERMALAPLSTRLASLLLAYSDLFGQDGESGVLIRQKLSLEDMARALGVTRRSASRSISEWRNSGLVDRYKGWLRIRDIEALRRIAGAHVGHLNYKFRLPGEPA